MNVKSTAIEPALHSVLAAAVVLMLASASAAISGEAASDRGSVGKQDFMKTYAGEPYTGFLEVRIKPPDGKGWTRYGRGSAHFTNIEDGRAKLVVFGAIDDENGDAGFAVEGTYDDSGWTSQTDNVTLQVNSNGKIVGEGIVPPESYRFSGSVSASTFNLDVRIGLAEATANGLSAGTTFRFAYELSRHTAVEDGAGDGQAPKKKASRSGTCRKIRYEMRPVASIGDGTMSMIQVPICIQ